MTTTGEEQGWAGRDGPGWWWWGRRRSAVLDVGLAAVSAAECGVEGAVFAGNTGLPAALGVLLGVLAGGALVVRRHWPIAVVLVAIAVTPAEMGFLLSIVGVYSLAASDVPRRITGLLAGMATTGVFVVTFVRMHQSVSRGGYDPGGWYVPLMSALVALGLTAPPLLLGLYVGARRRLMESLRERADSLERELSLLADRAEERAEWARTEERTRIAREMHDVVAHRVSLMVVHAAALQAVARKDPEKAVRNAALVGDMGRQALTELREMLGVLRAEPAVSKQGPGAVAVDAPLESVGRAAAAAASRADDPPGAAADLADLAELVGQSRAAGMVVELTVQEDAGGAAGAEYGPEVEQTAFRVVQEGLTNVHKHAAGAKTWVRVARRADEVAVQVENEAPGDGAAAAGLPSGGNGLVGMRERVLGLGGVFVAGATDAGGFRVSAVIPARAAAADGAGRSAPAAEGTG
ncbi:sensor histidine kinase [Streptomyces sp. NPDC060194]|uniref:sensor histidine kinase n=1 Tax=Streptomyces sp. NPDC060194 TaxID=3347069 RepID=UPI003657879C